MPAISPSPFVSPDFVNAVSTYVETQTQLTPDPRRHDTAAEAWQKLIDDQLIEWERDPGQVDDEGIEPPSAPIVRLAIQLAQAWKDGGFAAPDRVVPDPNGGIVFERRERDVSEVFHVWEDGTVEYRRFQGTRLVERRTL